ncbi:hypothetical protein Golax_024877 [Gossypium laxum]|uniref:Endonuclease/exonuclease/phosphatase domain-containing protein n=1 Tax=Gossypium laxum TaxID=34288 RepID=A0A7J8ZDF5_9ROSI|nr:hypothetical protein [Gossypium laxum]
MLKILNKRIKGLFPRLRWPVRGRSNSKIVIKVYTKPHDDTIVNGGSQIHQNGESGVLNSASARPIRIATFNAAMFSMAPAMPKPDKSSSFDYDNEDFTKSTNDHRPKGILKQSPLHPNSMNENDILTKQQKFVKSKLRVSINLPDNEISLLRNRQLSFSENEKEGGGRRRCKAPVSFSTDLGNWVDDWEGYRSRKTVLEVLKELDADILGLQDVKAEEEKGMRPLSDLAAALGMNYVFAESWAPEYGNAVLSKWPIKRWKVQKIFDDADFR